MTTKRILAALALVLVATTAQAQGGQAGGGMGQGGGGMGQGGGNRMNAMLFKDITLSADQQKKVDSIQAAGREAMRGMMQNGGMQDPANREKMTEMRKKQNDEIRKLLTPEQQATFDKK